VARSGSIGEEVRAICLALPGVAERTSHGAPAFFAGRQFVMLWVDGHHGNDFPHLWCAAPPGAQEGFVVAEPDRYFRPPYVGSRGWLGVRLDRDVDLDEIAVLCGEAYRVVAPARLVARLDDRAPPS
jgi:hypothetical protein